MREQADSAEETPVAGFTDLETTLAQKRWTQLTESDLEEAEGSRTVLARKVAERYRISVGEAKRQVRDLLRLARSAERGGASRGKRMQRALERAGSDVSASLIEKVEGAADWVRAMAVRLAGDSVTRKPQPRPAREDPEPESGGEPAEPAVEEGSRPRTRSRSDSV